MKLEKSRFNSEAALQPNTCRKDIPAVTESDISILEEHRNAYFIASSRKATSTGGVKGMRDLVDGYALEAIKAHYPAAQWESIGIAYLSRCVDAGGLTDAGLEAWGNMTADMGATVAGGKNA